MDDRDVAWRRALAEAEAWAAREAAGAMEAGDHARLVSWLRADPRHCEAYAQAAPREGPWPGLLLGDGGDDRLKGFE